MKILIIEDELKTEQYLRRGLTEAGFVTDGVRDGRDGLHLALTEIYDLVILDVMLPGIDGWEILQRMRRAERHVPVLILSARDQIVDRVKGLELGADDYLLKPFDFAELLSRVRAILRRGKANQMVEKLQVADLEINLTSRRVTRAGKRIGVTAKEFTLLEFIMRRQGEVLPRSLIASQVWDMSFDSDTNVIEVAMRRLRAKIDDDFDVKLIRTIRGMGYVLEAPEG